MNLEEVGELAISNFYHLMEVPEYGQSHGRSTLVYAAGCAALGCEYNRTGSWTPKPTLRDNSSREARQVLLRLLSLANELRDFLKLNEYWEEIEKLAKVSYDQLLALEEDEAYTACIQWRVTIGNIIAGIWLDYVPQLQRDYPKFTPMR